MVGVIGNAYRIEDRFAAQMVGERNLRAVAEVSGALPLMFAGIPELTDIAHSRSVWVGRLSLADSATLIPFRAKSRVTVRAPDQAGKTCRFDVGGGEGPGRPMCGTASLIEACRRN